MNDFNQQYAGRMDCGCQSSRFPMPVWPGRMTESGGFGWPGRPAQEDMDCGMPPSAVMPLRQGEGNTIDTMQPMPQQAPMLSQQPVQQPSMQQPECFAVKMETGKFPLAMSYVPIQQWSTPSSLEEGFRRGTIFAELDLPFMMGRCR